MPSLKPYGDSEGASNTCFKEPTHYNSCGDRCPFGTSVTGCDSAANAVEVDELGVIYTQVQILTQLYGTSRDDEAGETKEPLRLFFYYNEGGIVL